MCVKGFEVGEEGGDAFGEALVDVVVSELVELGRAGCVC